MYDGTHLQEHRDDVDSAIEQAWCKLLLQVWKLLSPWFSLVSLRKEVHILKPLCTIAKLELTSVVRNIRQPRWTANCDRTVRMVYTLKILGRGLCLDRVRKGLDREIKRKHPARSSPWNVA